MRVPLPSGIVTFVFTDMEGSTRLFHRLGERYVDLLERHRHIIREALDHHGGHEMSVEGDSFFAAFGEAEEALAACADAQLALRSEKWPDAVAVKVRMGVHSGLALPRGSDYVALAVHQASRVAAAAHGGQVLVTQDAVEALSRPWAELRFLGRFRLRDFDQATPLYQLTVPEPAESFPSIRAVPADGHNLVRPRTDTIGREELIARVSKSVGSGTLLTLVGPGGVGKTRVATEVGMAIAPDWPDGIWRVELDGIGEPSLVAPAIASVVGAPRGSHGDRWDDAIQHLRFRRAVLLLDNCEHLLSACREIVASVLASCPGMAVLLTSREPLHLEGEQLWPVEPLWSPGESTVDPVALLASPAGALFAERAAAVRPDFQVDSGNVAAIAAICARLDGLPLFLELAAAQVAFQAPEEILAGLEDRFRLLRSRDPSVSDRHRTGEGLIDWSYRLLPDPERVALRRVSVFGSSFSLGMAEAAVGEADGPSGGVAGLIWSLVDRSLLSLDSSAHQTRYRFLETVRVFARRLLDECGEREMVAGRLASWFLHRVGPWIPADRRWVGDVEQELDNLRTLIPLLAEEEPEVAQQLACTIGRYHDAAQSFLDGLEEVGRYVEMLQFPSPTRVSLLTTLADLHLRTGDIDNAERLVTRAEETRHHQGPPDWDDVGVDRTRGEIARRSGDLDRAVEIARTTLAGTLTERGRSRMLNLLGTASAALGDFDTAYQACSQELELNRSLGYERLIAAAQGNLAEVALRLGDIPAAARHQRASLQMALVQGSQAMVAFSLIVAARIAGLRGDWSTATRLHARAERNLDQLGLALYADDRQESERLLADARRQLGEEDFQRAVQDGGAIQLSEAAESADRVLEAVGEG